MTRALTPTWGYTYWPWTLIGIVVVVMVPEIYALATNVANTLSWYAWSQLHVRPVVPFDRHSAAWFLSQGMFLVIVTWLVLHIWYAQFRS